MLVDELSALHKSARMLAWLSKSLEDACARGGLTLARYRVLLLLGAGPLRAAELACVLNVRASTLTGLAVALERRGLIERAPSTGDRRGVELALTAAGAEARRRAERCLAEELQRLHRRFIREASAARMLRSSVAAYDQILARLVEEKSATASDPAPAAAPEPTRVR